MCEGVARAEAGRADKSLLVNGGPERERETAQGKALLSEKRGGTALEQQSLEKGSSGGATEEHGLSLSNQRDGM